VTRRASPASTKSAFGRGRGARHGSGRGVAGSNCFSPLTTCSPPTKNRGGQGDHLHPEEAQSVSIRFGAWLYPGKADQPHALEVQDVSLATEWTDSGAGRDQRAGVGGGLPSLRTLTHW